MTRLTEQTTAPISIDKAFAYTADFNHVQDWDPGVAESAQIGEGPVGEGTEFDVLVAFGARRIPMVYTITEFDPPNRMVLVGKGSALTAVDEITFSEIPQGTAITFTTDLTFKGMGRLFAPFMGGVLKGVVKKAVEGLATALRSNEATPTA